MRQRGHTSRLPAEKRGFTSNRTRAATRNTPFPLPETHTNATAHDGRDRSCAERKRGKNPTWRREKGGKIRPAGTISRAGMRAPHRGRWSLNAPSPKTTTSPCLLLRRSLVFKRILQGLQRDWLCQESGRRGSNPRQPAWKAGTLPLSYFRQYIGLGGDFSTHIYITYACHAAVA